MKNIFSFKLYLQGLRKIRTTGFAMSVVLVVLNAWSPLQNISTVSTHLREIDTVSFAPFGFIFLLFAPLLVYNMFSFLNERRSSDFFHSLPQKRICVYISFMSAVLTWIASALLISTLVNSMLWLLAESYTVTLRAVLMTFFGFLILALVTAGFMALAMALTGTTVANWLVFLLFFLFIRVCGFFFLYGLKAVCSMFNTAHSLLAVFELKFFLPIALVYDLSDPGNLSVNIVVVLLYWFAVAVALLVLSSVAYRRRRSESATKSAPSRLMQNVYRIGVAFPFIGCGVYLLIFAHRLYMALLCMLVGFLVWCIFELLTTKKVKNLIRALPLFLVPFIMTAVGFGMIYAAKGICIATVPEREAIVSVKSEWTSRPSNNRVYEIVSSTEITDPEILDKIYEAITYTVEAEKDDIYRGGSYAVTMTLRSGKKVTYNLLADFSLYQLFENSYEVQSRIFDIYNEKVSGIAGPTIASEKLPKIWETVKEEFASMNIAQRRLYLGLSEAKPTDLYIMTYGTYNGEPYYRTYMLDPFYTPKALALYMQYYEEEQSALAKLQTVKEEIQNLGAENVRTALMRIENCTLGFHERLKYEDFEKIKEYLSYLETDSHLTDYENAKNIYRLTVGVVIKSDGGSKTLVDEKLYFSLTEEDLERFRQIMYAPTNPIT